MRVVRADGWDVDQDEQAALRPLEAALSLGFDGRGMGRHRAAFAAAVLEAAGVPLEIVRRSDTAKGFVVVPKRWTVGRAFGWLGRCRRLAKDLENRARSAAAFVILAIIRLKARRIARLRNQLL